MILDLFKKLYLKKRLKNTLKELEVPSQEPIYSVGVLVNAAELEQVSSLLEALLLSGLDVRQLQIVCHTTKPKSSEDARIVYFTGNAIDSSGEIKETDLSEFLDTPFDLLINYYHQSSVYLHYLTKMSKAKFNVGIDKDYKLDNHLIINVAPAQTELFTQELYKYLTILNKI